MNDSLPETPPPPSDAAPRRFLRVMLVDDETPARARLRELLSDISGELPLTVVSEAGNGVEALATLSTTKVDVALIDIRMPKMSGIELARHLASMPDPPAVIFTTAYDKYAMEAFELRAVDYLLKPIRARRLLEALSRARLLRPSSVAVEQLREADDKARSYLSCYERGRLLLVPVDEIKYLRAEQKYVMAHTGERKYWLDESLAQLEREFAERFIRLHRSILVARNAITGFERAPPTAAKASQEGEEREERDAQAEAQWIAVLDGIDERLPVSRRQWAQVKALARKNVE
ncbi:MAG: LytTR family DNA-binding domain-containing protein [Betaproteobacteria bacterium]|nr:LytTR family DNA-binding domain-containing protein [Betaproteobacteria bacterium]